MEKTHAIWQTHISDWQRSGLTQAEYCREKDLKTHSFRYWKLKLGIDEEPLFIEIPAQPSKPESPDAAKTIFELRLSQSGGLEIKINLNWSGRLFA